MYVIGVDGGQTTTKCALFTLEGQLLGMGSSGGLLHLAVEGGAARMADSLREAIRAAFTAANLPMQSVRVVGMGLSGIESAAAPEAATVRNILREILPVEQVWVENDGVAALIGAHLGAAGAIVISGTGSILVGLRQDRQIVRVGGWGWLVGDEGSAVWLGMAAVRSVFHALDGVGAPTALTAALLPHFGVSDVRAIKRLIYATDFGARGFAALAPLVGQAAAAADDVAQSILAESAAALAQAVDALHRQMDFGDQVLPLALIGGVWDHILGMRAAFAKTLSRMPIRLSAPSLPPIYGAALAAIRTSGGDWAKAAERMQRA